MEPFRLGEDALRRLAGLRISDEAVRVFAEEIGRKLAEHLQPPAPQTPPAEVVPPVRPSQPIQWDLSIPPRGQQHFDGQIVYISIDAFSTPTIGLNGKREYKMLYLGQIYDPRKEHTIYLTSYDHEILCSRLRYLAGNVGLADAPQWVALTDGGAGLEEALRKCFGGQTEYVLDFWHATEHLYAWARNRFGAESEDFNRWGAEARQRLKDHGGERLLVWLGEWEPDKEDASHAEWEKLRNYIRNNVHRMDYPTYQSRGWDIGSGPVEAGCKRLGSRLKGAGMKWIQSNAEALMHLRALYLSGDGLWDNFWQVQHSLAV